MAQSTVCMPIGRFNFLRRKRGVLSMKFRIFIVPAIAPGFFLPALVHRKLQRAKIFNILTRFACSPVTQNKIWRRFEIKKSRRKFLLSLAKEYAAFS